MRTGLTAGSGMVLGMIFGIAVGHMVLGMIFGCLLVLVLLSRRGDPALPDQTDPLPHGCTISRVSHTNTMARKSNHVLCQNCVRYPLQPRPNTVIYGDTPIHIAVAESR